MKSWLTLGTLALALTASGVRADSKNPAPASVAEMSAAETEQWLMFFDKLVEAVEVNAQSCDKMAADVSTVIDTNRPSIAIARTARAHGKKLPHAAQDHMLDGVRRMGPGIDHCIDNQHVKAAFSKLEVSAPAK